MATFSEGGVPRELLATFNKLEAEVAEKKGIVEKEKEHIKDLEKDIRERGEATAKLRTENVQLELAIKHTMSIFEHQKVQIKTLEDTGELLRAQAKLKEELYVSQKEKNAKILNDCEQKYHNFKEMAEERMHQYDNIPLVAELKKQHHVLANLQNKLEAVKLQNLEVRKEIEEKKAKRDQATKYQSITEWGVAVAKKMKFFYEERAVAQARLKRVKALEKEVEELEEVKRQMEKKKETAQKSCHIVQPQPVKMDDPAKRKAESKAGRSSSFLQKCLVPSFDTIFKKKLSSQANLKQVSGASGSRMMSGVASLSLPNIPSLLVGKPVTPVQHLPVETPRTGQSDIDTSPDQSETARMSPTPKKIGSNLYRSKSLTLLMPIIKPLKKAENPIKNTSSMLGRPLSDWLKSSSSNDQTHSQNKHSQMELKSQASHRDDFLLPKTPTLRKSPQKPAADNKENMSPSSEIPLIRQVQQKNMMQQVIEQSESQTDILNASMEIDAEDSADNSEPPQEKGRNMLRMFDGPVFQVPMPTADAEENTSSAEKSLPSTPGRATPEEENAASEKSPGEYGSINGDFGSAMSPGDSFVMSTNYLIKGDQEANSSPAKADNPQQPSLITDGFHGESAHGRRDAIMKTPQPPPPVSGGFFGGSPASCVESPSFDGFTFGNMQDSSSTTSNATSPFAMNAFASNSSDKQRQASTPGSSQSSSMFSFNFGAQSPPDEGSSGFSFSFGGATDASQSAPAEASPFSFDLGGGAPQASSGQSSGSGSLFSSIFGCGK